MERLVEITREEYCSIGDAGGWVYGIYVTVSPDVIERPSDNDRAWESRKRLPYTRFFTKVSDDV